MNNSPTIEKTRDGSTTLYSHRYGQHYHNPNGAVAESRHVFFEIPGLPAALQEKNELNIFETGFGTGLNLILLLDYLRTLKNRPQVIFHSVEAYPVAPQTAAEFDFGKELLPLQPNEVLTDIFSSLSPGINTFQITPQVTLELFIGFFDDEPPTKKQRFDFIFHDAFSPEVNADLWTPDVFRKLLQISRPDALLSTYCAASSARAAMVIAGWKVARARGALGKREMTVASPDEKNLSKFKRVNEKRLADRWEKGDFK